MGTIKPGQKKTFQNVVFDWKTDSDRMYVVNNSGKDVSFDLTFENANGSKIIRIPKGKSDYLSRSRAGNWVSVHVTLDRATETCTIS